MKLLTLKKIVVFIMFAIFTSCSMTNIKPTFVQFGKENVRFLDSASKDLSGTSTFFVDHYKANKYCEKYIDSVAFKLGEAKKNKYLTYSIQFYKLSEKTNAKHLSENPRDLDRYSYTHDYIYSYYWSDGNFVSRQKFKNGKMIEPNTDDIVISDIP
jgi:hypothetical protein